MTALVVIAKECLPGRVKTRLASEFTPEEAAELASASLADTLEAIAALTRVVGVPDARQILFFDGEMLPPLPGSFEVVAQPGGTLDERLAWLFDRLDEPTLLVGMDTPQLGAGDVAAAVRSLAGADELPGRRSDVVSRGPAGAGGVVDAWFGPATDGGFWALGMQQPRGDLIRGVGMSRPTTGAEQRARLVAAGLRVADLGMLTDVDEPADARAVAALAPSSRFAATLQVLTRRRVLA